MADPLPADRIHSVDVRSGVRLGAVLLAADLGCGVGGIERVLLPAVRAAAPTTAIVADGSCRTQIGHRTPRRAVHLAQLLASGLRPLVSGPRRIAALKRLWSHDRFTFDPRSSIIAGAYFMTHRSKR